MLSARSAERGGGADTPMGVASGLHTAVPAGTPEHCVLLLFRLLLPLPFIPSSSLAASPRPGIPKASHTLLKGHSMSL